MLEYLPKIATLFAILMFLPMFVEILLIIKYYHSKNYRIYFGYKLLLFNSFIYSLYLVGALLDPAYRPLFLFLSFLMLPAYFLLLLKQFHKQFRRNYIRKANREVSIKLNTKKRYWARKERERKRAKKKELWT